MVARRLRAHAREGADVAFIAELKAVGGFLARQGCGGRGMGRDKAVDVGGDARQPLANGDAWVARRDQRAWPRGLAGDLQTSRTRARERGARTIGCGSDSACMYGRYGVIPTRPGVSSTGDVALVAFWL
jgi:hypothetical protein